MTDRVVQAAGGVVWRPAADTVEVLLVHRPRYDDWSLPKGKLTDREHPLVGAVREVFEETAVHGVPQVRLPATRYLTGVPGVAKEVRYWSMRLAGTEPFQPNDEIDKIRWLSTPEAMTLATYGHDRTVLAAFADLPPVTAELVVVRQAGTGGGSGQDDSPPLDPQGRADPELLAEVLAVFRPDRVVSARPWPCRATVAPLAARLGLVVEIDERLDYPVDAEAGDRREPAAEQVPGPARRGAEALRELLPGAGTTIVCGQAQTITAALAELTGWADPQGFATAPGEGWLVAMGPSGPVGVDRLEVRPDPARG
jgi:8-oxo-dGTP pyrophosphatase MutT (NUDIX family)